MQTPLRGYQERATKQALAGSTIVVLPTGSGKTLIAAAVAAATSTSGKRHATTLFLVPTRLLVEQQAQELRNETGLAVAQYMAGLAPPDMKEFDILVALPAAYRELCKRHDGFDFNHYRLIIFDEVHHVIKRHPYRTIARQIQACEHRPKILGITASLTYAIGKGAHMQECPCS